ncbi:MAG: hypothetical protein ACJ8DW_10090 [Microvirga sp.]
MTLHKERRDELFAEHADLLKSAEQQNEIIRKLIGEGDALEQQLSALKQGVPAQADEAHLKPMERDSAVKLIIGIAVSGYRYDPNANRNEATLPTTWMVWELGLTQTQSGKGSAKQRNCFLHKISDAPSEFGSAQPNSACRPFSRLYSEK